MLADPVESEPKDQGGCDKEQFPAVEQNQKGNQHIWEHLENAVDRCGKHSLFMIF